ncbi:transketolase family protein [Christensenella tenuis]|jgi:transketolase|uniref:Transketolase family protein n=1 Tax=Christensenella tenuis TaxID=2763033 RepID=A0ABR7EGA2_9FIRM|nr:transketolase C-terminal domain-containing protein [Christensenella tenuis]MBC5648208.1 transketolase family protein [Christensenella tenuis]
MEKTLRAAYGEALAKYGGDERMVVLDADVSGSTLTGMFGKAYPQRFFNVGIAEANMTAMAAGFAAQGKIPFVNCFSVFLSSVGLLAARTYGSYSGLNMKLAGAYGGLSDSFDGPTHHSVEDLAVMRALPGFEVIVPCDPVQVDWAVRYALQKKGPLYLRLSRDAMHPVYGKAADFEPGKGKIVREGADATVIACGMMVGEALLAAQELEQEGIRLRVVDLFFVKPVDNALILRCAEETGAIVTAEEHSVIGGLGGAVSETLSAAGIGVPHEFAGLSDTHAECGPYAALMRKYGIDAAAVAGAVRRAVRRKR